MKKIVPTFETFVNEMHAASPQEILDSAKFVSKDNNDKEYDYEIEHKTITAVNDGVAKDICDTLQKNGIKCEQKGNKVKLK